MDGPKGEGSSSAVSRYVSYIRVSTDRQGISGLGLDAQRKSIAEYLARQAGALEPVAEFVEVESGKSAANRPELLKAIKRCRLQGATLLVAKLDRLSRDLWFITTIQKFGVKFICADNPEINDLTLHILGAMAQHERQLISDRTRAALISAKARGVKLGNPNLLAVRNTDTSAAREAAKKKADQFAREVLPLLESAIASGVKSLSALARLLNEQGIETQRKSKWTPMGVKRVFARERKSDLLDDILKLG